MDGGAAGVSNMTPTIKLGAAVLCGAAIGTMVIEALHAQAKPPVFHVTLQDVSNAAALNAEFIPVVRDTIRKHGGKPIAGSAPIVFDGPAPAQRVAIIQWPSIEVMRAWWESPEFKQAREVGNKYAKFTVFAVEGLPGQ